jgi:hypothetical protein
VLSVGLILLSFIVYQILADSSLLPKSIGWPATRNAKWFFARLLGFVLLGATAYMVEARTGNNSLAHLVTPQFTGSAYWMLAGIGLIFLINAFTTKPGEDNHYPQLRYDSWNAGLILINTITWVL